MDGQKVEIETFYGKKTILHSKWTLLKSTSTYRNNHFYVYFKADRTFHDLDNTWNLASGGSTTDVKELIPELFYLPEMLINGDRLDLGLKQNGQRVDHIILPPWAKG